MSLRKLLLYLMVFFILTVDRSNVPVMSSKKIGNVSKPSDAYSYSRPIISALPYESAYIIYVDKHADVVKTVYTSREIVTDLYTPWELIFKSIPKGTKTIYYIHNHPREIPVRLGWADGDINNPSYQPSIDYLQFSDNDLRYAGFWSYQAKELGIKWVHMAVNRFGYIATGYQGQAELKYDESISRRIADGLLFRIGYPVVQGVTWVSNRLFGPGPAAWSADRLFNIGYAIAS